MAVATPVLERTQTQSAEERIVNSSAMSADELHNSKIKENYRRLIDPDFYLNEDRGGSVVQQEEQVVVTQSPVLTRPAESARPAQPYLVQGARADAEIFRADSAINRQAITATTVVVDEEEESEDLRPTQTTIQYKTVDKVEIQREQTRQQPRDSVLGKREKVIIATFVSVVVALFVLVIVNSIIISNLNNELAVIQNSLTAARGALAGANADIATLVSPENIADFAQSHGLILK